MTERYKIGDRVGWNSEAGRVSGTIIRVHTHDFNYKGHHMIAILKDAARQ